MGAAGPKMLTRCWLVGSVALVALALASLAADNQDGSACINVEEPGYAGGDRQCFGGDEIGMVCGWDGEPNEAYCEIGTNGFKVCARKQSGGRCNQGDKPFSDKTHDNEPGKEEE